VLARSPQRPPWRNSNARHPGSLATLWIYTIDRLASRQSDAGQPEKAAQAYRRALAYLEEQPATDWTRESIAAIQTRPGS